MTESDIWADLQWRGLIAVSTDKEQLATLLNGTPITVYCGFDPTAPSLHLGNLVQLLLLRRLQLAGHTPLALVGGSTGLIGDPKPNAERTLNTPATVATWTNALRAQISRFLDFETPTNPAQIVNNLDWMGGISALDFLRDIGKHFRVGTMIRKDAVQSRLQSEAGISFTEFAYQILQGYDFLELYRQHGCLLQTGGSDQWGNLTSGIGLIHHVTGATVHALGTPLILNSDGTKFGKSEGNAIWLDSNLTTPFAFHQFWLNTADTDVVDRLKVFTLLTHDEIKDLAEQVATAPHRRLAQRRLADEVTTLVHGETAAQEAAGAAQALFGRGDLATLSLAILTAASEGLPTTNGKPGDPLDRTLVNLKQATSLRHARELITQGAISINNQKITDTHATLPAFLHNQFLIIKTGKRQIGAVTADN